LDTANNGYYIKRCCKKPPISWWRVHNWINRAIDSLSLSLFWFDLLLFSNNVAVSESEDANKLNPIGAVHYAQQK
jgi:hypothetical protein